MTIEQLISELRRCAGFEDLDGAYVAAEKLAALDAASALTSLLEELDEIDLTDDGGDVGDEVWRTRQAVMHGLDACRDRAIKTDAALDVLEQQLRDPDWFARLGAAEALREMGGDRARRLLERASHDTDARVVAAASATWPSE